MLKILNTILNVIVVALFGHDPVTQYAVARAKERSEDFLRAHAIRQANLHHWSD